MQALVPFLKKIKAAISIWCCYPLPLPSGLGMLADFLTQADGFGSENYRSECGTANIILSICLTPEEDFSVSFFEHIYAVYI